MCVISGLVYFNNKIVESSALEKMNKALFQLLIVALMMEEFGLKKT